MRAKEIIVNVKKHDKMHKTENCPKKSLRKLFLISKDIFNLYFNSFFLLSHRRLLG